MKRTIHILLFIISALSLYALQEQKIIFHLNDGNTKQYNISDIEDMSVIAGETDYTMMIFYNGSQRTEFETNEIESIKFEADGETSIMSIYISGTPNSFVLSSIDSISFTIKQPSAPVITAIEPASGFIGDEITITGTDFGEQQGIGFVSFNALSAVEYSSWSDTQIKVKVPPGAVSSKVSVTANGIKSNEIDFTILMPDIFQIISITPKAVKIGDEVTIKGTKLGSTQGTSFISFNGIHPISYTSWSDTEIKVKMPRGAKTGNISVTVNSEKSNELDYSIIPVLTSVTQVYAGISEKVTLTGIGFGDSIGTGKVTFNKATATIYAMWNDSIITAEVPPNAESGNVYVTASANKSNGLDFAIIQHIVSITPASAKIGDEVTITGTKFGFVQGTVSFNGKDAVEYPSWKETEIKVKVPQGAKNGKISVTIDNKKSNEVDFAIIPQILNITPVSAKTGTVLTITGTGFGDSLGTGNKVIFKRVNVTKFTSWSDTEIKLKVPEDAESGKVSVTVGIEKSNGVDFVVLPYINSIVPNSAKTGDKITLVGTGFGDKRDSSNVTFNGSIGSTYLYWSTKGIEVRVPTGAMSGKVSVIVGGNKSNELDLVVTVPPYISGISPDSAGIGDIVTITGANFGDTRGTSVVTFKTKNATDYTSWGPTQIKVKVPTGAATGKVSVTVNGIKSNEVDFQIGSAAGNYEEVTIGTQTWMKKNLDVTHYRNGDEIPQVTDADEWENLTTGAWCYYNNDEANGQVYGKLYNWYAINDSRGLAPEGWHIPSTNEWKTLRDYLGNENDAGGPLKESGTEHWKSPNTGATNETGFTALPGGERAYTSYSDYRFQLLHDVCYFWSSTYNGSNVDRIVFTYNYAEFYMGINLSNTKKYGQSVRCIKD